MITLHVYIHKDSGSFKPHPPKITVLGLRRALDGRNETLQVSREVVIRIAAIGLSVVCNVKCLQTIGGDELRDEVSGRVGWPIVQNYSLLRCRGVSTE